MSQSKILKDNVFVLVSSLVFVVLSIFAMSGRLPWQDEDFTLFLIAQSWPDFWHIVSVREMNMSLYYILLKLWSELSSAPVFLRTLSVIFTLTTASYVFRLATKVSSKQAAHVAIVVCFFSAILFRYSQELRGYSLFALTSTIAVFYWLEVLSKDYFKSWFYFTLSCILVVYSHMLVAVVITAQFILLLYRANFSKQKIVKVALSTFVIWLFIFPLAYQFLQLGSNPISWAQTLTVKGGVDLLNDLFVTPFLDSNKVRLVLLAISALLIFSLLARRDDNSQKLNLFMLLAISLGVFSVLALYVPIMNARFVVNLIPLFAVLLAIAYTRLPSQLLKAPLVVTFFSISAFSVISLMEKPGDAWQQVKFELVDICSPEGRSLVACFKPSAILGLHKIKSDVLAKCPNLEFVTSFAAKSLYTKTAPSIPTDLIKPDLSDYQQTWFIEYYVPVNHDKLVELHNLLASSYNQHELFHINSNGNFVRLYRYFK